MSDFTPPRVGDVVRVSLEGKVTGVQKFPFGGGQIDLETGNGKLGCTSSVHWGPLVRQEVAVEVLTPHFVPGDVADIRTPSRRVVRAMFVRTQEGREKWVTPLGAEFLAVDSYEATLVLPAEPDGEGS